jgi:hypothetical protein
MLHKTYDLRVVENSASLITSPTLPTDQLSKNFRMSCSPAIRCTVVSSSVTYITNLMLPTILLSLYFLPSFISLN